jgi:hypothetical protein
MTRFGILCVATLAVMLLSSGIDAAVDRKSVCGSESDCVVIKNENGGVLKIDDLDFSQHSVGDIIKRLPEWFGKRPAILYRKGKAMAPEDTLEMWQLPIGAELTLNTPTAKGASTGKGKGVKKPKEPSRQDL